MSNLPDGTMPPTCGISLARASGSNSRGVRRALVAPVDMGVDLQDPDWLVIRKAGEEGNGRRTSD
jgi:hypothetical protein